MSYSAFSASAGRPLISPETADLLIQRGSEILMALYRRHVSDLGGYVADDRGATERPAAAVIDPYRVLGIKKTATAAEIKRRVRQLAKVFHPDLSGGDAEKMAEVNDAARVLLADLGGKPRR